MEGVLSKFLNEMEELRKLLRFYTLENQLRAGFIVDDESDPSKHLLFELSKGFKEFYISKRTFNYNSLIISLYGYFERFVENSITSYIDQVSQVVMDYGNLPEKISLNHYQLSLTLLSKVNHARYEGILTKEAIIAKLHKCMNESGPYQLNIEAFLQHNSNFRSRVVDEVFQYLNFPKISDRIKADREFYLYSIQRLGLNDGDVISEEISFGLMNELAQRRNDVAHGIETEILQNNLVEEFIIFFEHYSKALTRVCASDLLKFTQTHLSTPMGHVTGLFRNGSVVCLATNHVPLKLGDELIGFNTERIVKATAMSIQIQGESVLEVDNLSNYEIGVGLSQPFQRNFQIVKVLSKNRLLT